MKLQIGYRSNMHSILQNLTLRVVISPCTWKYYALVYSNSIRKLLSLRKVCYRYKFAKRKHWLQILALPKVKCDITRGQTGAHPRYIHGLIHSSYGSAWRLTCCEIWCWSAMGSHQCLNLTSLQLSTISSNNPEGFRDHNMRYFSPCTFFCKMVILLT